MTQALAALGFFGLFSVPTSSSEALRFLELGLELVEAFWEEFFEDTETGDCA